MKKMMALLSVAVMLVGLCACTNEPETVQTTTTAPSVDATATDADIAKLDGLYAGRELYFGEMHSHADTGGNSDGKHTLDQWKAMMDRENLDFATIVDHDQLLHMTLDEWDNSMFIGGSEIGGTVKDSPSAKKKLHFNMLFSTVEEFENLLNMYPIELQYIPSGGLFDGSRDDWKVAELNELSNNIYEKGGLFVHVHPYLENYCLEAEDPLDYMFGDVMGLEVFRSYPDEDMNDEQNVKSYKLWTDLLALDKRVIATSGSDAHASLDGCRVCPGAIYSEEKNAELYLDYIRAGDVVAGPAGIRMTVGDTRMGGECSFAGQRLVLSTGAIHSYTYDATHTYRVDLYDDKGLVFSEEISGVDQEYFAIDADADAKFYRANVYDVTKQCIVAVGNPIWNG